MTNIYAISRLSIAFVWIYHGLVPKLLGPHEDELIMNMAVGFSYEMAHVVAIIGGSLELLMGALVLVCWHHRWPITITIFSMVALLFGVALSVPQLVLGAFNPVTINLTVIALSVINLNCDKTEKTS